MPDNNIIDDYADAYEDGYLLNRKTNCPLAEKDQFDPRQWQLIVQVFFQNISVIHDYVLAYTPEKAGYLIRLFDWLSTINQSSEEIAKAKAITTDEAEKVKEDARQKIWGILDQISTERSESLKQKDQAVKPKAQIDMTAGFEKALNRCLLFCDGNYLGLRLKLNTSGRTQKSKNSYYELSPGALKEFHWIVGNILTKTSAIILNPQLFQRPVQAQPVSKPQPQLLKKSVQSPTLGSKPALQPKPRTPFQLFHSLQIKNPKAQPVCVAPQTAAPVRSFFRMIFGGGS